MNEDENKEDNIDDGKTVFEWNEERRKKERRRMKKEEREETNPGMDVECVVEKNNVVEGTSSEGFSEENDYEITQIEKPPFGKKKR